VANGVKKDYIDQLDALLEDPSAVSRPDARGLQAGLGLLLAVADDDFAPAAIEVVRALQERRSAKPSVLYVIEIGAAVPEATVVAMTLEEQLRDPLMRAKQETEMKGVLHLVEGPQAAWPFSMQVGSVAANVVESAKRQSAELIVMGLNRHAAIGRAVGNDTVREVMTLGGLPVLAVRPQLYDLPKVVVAAIDFSHASVRAAHLARRLMDERGRMHLVFVEAGMLDDRTESLEGSYLIRTKGVEAAFAQLVAELEPSGGVTIDTVTLKGNPAAEITRFCERIKPDLVAIGSQRHRLLERLLLGSVARSITGDGRWSMLVTPPEKAVHP
jgi:nucleotide-binding universal stress UspA family protein